MPPRIHNPQSQPKPLTKRTLRRYGRSFNEGTTYSSTPQRYLTHALQREPSIPKKDCPEGEFCDSSCTPAATKGIMGLEAKFAWYMSKFRRANALGPISARSDEELYPQMLFLATQPLHERLPIHLYLVPAPPEVKFAHRGRRCKRLVASRFHVFGGKNGNEIEDDDLEHANMLRGEYWAWQMEPLLTCDPAVCFILVHTGADLTMLSCGEAYDQL